MMKFFNTAGPMKPDLHYTLPPLARLAKDEVPALIAAQKYFALHAPRQTGKTTCLLALVAELKRLGTYHALYINVEAAQAARENVPAALDAILTEIAQQAQFQLKDELPARLRKEAGAQNGGFAALSWLLMAWSQAVTQPIALYISFYATCRFMLKQRL